MHQDKYTGADVYQMADPAPDVPGGLRWLSSFTEGRSMLYKRRDANGVLQDLHVADDFPTAQVIAQSARAAGTPRSEDGARSDLWHGRINNATAGLEVTVRLDVRLSALSGKALAVPYLSTTFAYRIFHGTPNKLYKGVGRGARPAAELVSEEERFSKLHCGCCRKPLSESHNHKAVEKGATYWVCGECDKELSACGGLDRQAEWKCPTAADGGSDCLCWSAAAKKQPDAKKRPKSFSSSKKQRWQAQRMQELQESDP
jgi:hypothetical protein